MDDMLLPLPLAVLNTLAALASIGFAAVALVSPRLLVPDSASPDAAARYYAKMYAARAVPLGVATASVAWMGGSSTLLAVVFLVAAAAQLGDALVGLATGTRGQVAGAVIAMIIHVAAVSHLLVTG